MASKNEPLAPKLNWTPDPLDPRDHMFTARKQLVPTASLPTHVDLRAGCSTVHSQGQTGSCVAQTFNGWNEYNHRTMLKDPNYEGSTWFIYYTARRIRHNPVTDSGTYLRDAIKAMATYGTCRESTWPPVMSKLNSQPVKSAYDEAAKYPIKEYMRLTTKEQIMQALAEGHPVAIGFTCFESLLNSETSRTGVVPLPEKGERVTGGHAVLLIGYDSDKRLFYFRNSWGRNWGNKGYGALPFEYFERPGYSADYWVVIR